MHWILPKLYKSLPLNWGIEICLIGKLHNNHCFKSSLDTFDHGNCDNDAKWRQYKIRQGNWNYTQSGVLQELSSWYMQLVVYLPVTFIPWRASISSFFGGSIGWCSTESTSNMETGKSSLSQTCHTVLYTLHETPLFGLALYTLTSADIFSILFFMLLLLRRQGEHS